IRRRRKDGSPIDLLVSTAATRDRNDEISGIMSVYLDITERKRTGDQLKRQSEQLARTNAELEEYAYAASHDLQEPLRVISLYSQLLVKTQETRLDQDGKEYLAMVQVNAN